MNLLESATETMEIKVTLVTLSSLKPGLLSYNTNGISFISGGQSKESLKTSKYYRIILYDDYYVIPKY